MELFHTAPQILTKAPGRVNIIGEHTDYNGGFVLPVGIDKNIYVFSSQRNDDIFNINSFDFQEADSFPIKNLVYNNVKRWSNY